MKLLKKIRSLILPRYHRVWRTWDFVRYDIPNFVKNVWLFRSELTNTFEWDAMSSLKIMRSNLERVANYLEKNGREVAESRLKKVEKIRRAVVLIDLHLNEEFISWAEDQTGETLIDREIRFEKCEDREGLFRLADDLTEEERAHNGRIYAAAQEIATDTWMELFEILRGQDTKVYRILSDLYKGDHKQQAEMWDDWYDGSGLKHWWD
jgi:hypothetical protein